MPDVAVTYEAVRATFDVALTRRPNVTVQHVPGRLEVTDEGSGNQRSRTVLFYAAANTAVDPGLRPPGASGSLLWPSDTPALRLFYSQNISPNIRVYQATVEINVSADLSDAFETDWSIDIQDQHFSLQQVIGINFAFRVDRTHPYRYNGFVVQTARVPEMEAFIAMVDAFSGGDPPDVYLRDRANRYAGEQVTYLAGSPTASVSLITGSLVDDTIEYEAGQPTVDVTYLVVLFADEAVSYEAGTPTLSASFTVLPPIDRAVSYEAGTPTLSASFTVLPPIDRAVSYEAGTPTLSASFTVLPPIDRAVSYEAGTPSLSVAPGPDAPSRAAAVAYEAGQPTFTPLAKPLTAVRISIAYEAGTPTLGTSASSQRVAALPVIAPRSALLGTGVRIPVPQASQGLAPFRYRALFVPEGLSFDTVNVQLYGRPTRAGIQAFYYVVEDAAGTRARGRLELTVRRSEHLLVSARVQTTALLDNLLDQWQDALRLKALLRGQRELTDDHQLRQLQEAERKRSLDEADTFWLDALGLLVGSRRPTTAVTTMEDRFGFDDAGVGFDQAGFRSVNPALAPRQPVSDACHRGLIRMRARLLRSKGTIEDYEEALDSVFLNPVITDNADFTVTVTLDEDDPVTDGDLTFIRRAIIMPAGVSITITR